jgi:hypothetical protein
MSSKHHTIQHLLSVFPSDLFNGFVGCVSSARISGRDIMTQQDMTASSRDRESLWSSFIQTITDYILSIPIEYQPRRGDTIGIHTTNIYEISPTSYVFWTGSEAVDRFYTPYDINGTIPKCFNTLEEFGPNYWAHINDCNRFHVRPSFISKFELKGEPSFATNDDKNYLRISVILGRWCALLYMQSNKIEK